MNAVKIAFMAAVFVAMGFAAERIKVSLNHYLEFGSRIEGFDAMTSDEREASLNQVSPEIPYDYYYNHGRVGVYHRFSLRQLAVFKWLFAAGLVALYLAVARLFLGWMDEGRDTVVYLYVFVAIAVVISGVFFVLTKMSWNPNAAYAVARKVLGFLHSPLPLLLALFTSRMRTAFH